MASTSSPTELKKWDAFISFRGKDIRYGLLSHLKKASKQKQINAFIDDELDKGEEISQSLLEKIEDSHVSVVIFSENYADSPWCLDELVKIVECREISGQVVLPAFYKVDPTDVQGLRGNFGKAFHKLKEELKDCLHKVGGWSHALKVTSNLTGWDSRNIKSESKLVKEIVEGVIAKLSQISSNDSCDDGLVGIESRVKMVESLLQIGLAKDNRTIGIWGMGGSGKTTIASEILNRNMTQFDAYCFVMNVLEETKSQTFIMLRDKIISQLLGDKAPNVINIPKLPDSIRRRLQMKKVIIVFDDLNDSDHLKRLAGECDLFNKGSRIIVTSRDKQVLKNVCLTDEYIYKVEELSGREALQLFCLHAFKQNHPREGFQDISREMIRYAQGNPLAVKVLGSNLYDKNVEEWKSELQKLKDIPDMKIQNVLRISYDRLDDNEKSIFLDIACFFNGRNILGIERVLKDCGFFPKSGISHLVDKSLISISEYRVNMHGLLQQMGKNIVYEECTQPESRSRLWKLEDISRVLTKDKGTKKVKGILLRVSFMNEDMEVSSTAFKAMYNLRFFKFDAGYLIFHKELYKRKLHLPNGLEFLPEELRYLHWDCYPLEFLPLKFCPNNLVTLCMRDSQLNQLWEGDDKKLANLRVMDLSYSQHLIRIPELSGALNLEVLDLMGCVSLVEIPSSIQYLSKLTKLNLEGCTSLCSLPSCHHLKNLKELCLRRCSKLRECSDFPCNITSLVLDETAIEIFPSSVENCSQLVYLSLINCTKQKELPENIGYLESLERLNFNKSGIKTLPSSMNQLRKLEYLSCRGCDGLSKLSLLAGLSCLKILDLGNCGISEIPVSIGSLVSLEILYLDGNNFEEVPASMNQLANLELLYLSNCKRLGSLPLLPCSSPDHQSWKRLLDFSNCINLESKTIMDHVLMERHLVKQEIVSFCVPGVGVPQWMMYRNEDGSSLSNIRLDNTKIIGLSLCTVVDPIKFNLWCDVQCCVVFKDEFGSSCKSIMSFWIYYNLDVQHVFLWHSKFDFEQRFTEASFQFYIRCADGTDSKWIKKCGVHPVFENDCVVRGKKRMRNDDRNEDDQDEENQPSLKKQEEYNDYLDLNLS